MDPLSDLLGGIRAEGSVIAQPALAAPWSIRFTDRAPLTMISVMRGGGVLVLPDGAEHPLTAGDTAVVKGPAPFHLADAPGRPAAADAHEISCFLDCTAEPADPPLDAVAAQPDSTATTALVVGAYRASGRRHERLVRALPDAVLLHDDPDDCAWMDAVLTGPPRHRAGAQAMMDRLLDWGLVCTLQAWFERQGDRAPAWYRGLADPVVGPALESIHRRPARAWTVAGLAAEAGVSRALFAKRFSQVVGQPPLTYLTEWRMTEAEELLADPELTVAAVAKAVGYADPFGVSAAFKRHRGASP
ncbi:MAG: AraC family transcriptional regulator, partial [Mycobacteriaceae bacterium]|nr:AraC family transcriptional regulator [Mycobacteriaceae bacterium]